MGLNVNFRCWWPYDLVASPPAGWLEDTEFIDRFCSGEPDTFTGSTNGGAATHLHDTVNHSHTGNAHPHTVTGNAAGLPLTGVSIASAGGTKRTVRLAHPHESRLMATAVITYQNADLGNTSSVAMIPASIKMVVIKPTDANQEVPDDAFCFTDDGAAPTGYSITGTGTPDYDGKFIIGASSGGADGGDATGSATHGHTLTASGSHDHTIDNHAHAGSPSGEDAGYGPMVSGRTTVELYAIHHTITLTSQALSDLSNDNVSIDDGSSEPAYVKLLGIFNTSGGATTPTGVILGFVDGIAGGVPEGWEFVEDTDGKQIKITKTVGQIGVTGGSNTHTHTSPNHKHTHGTHIHTATDVYAVARDGAESPGTSITRADDDGHEHSWTVGLRTPTMQNTAITMSSPDSRYPFRTMVFLRKVEEAPSEILVRRQARAANVQPLAPGNTIRSSHRPSIELPTGRARRVPQQPQARGRTARTGYRPSGELRAAPVGPFTRRTKRAPRQLQPRGRTTRTLPIRATIIMATPVHITRDFWVIRWSSPLAGPFYVWRDGSLIGVTHAQQMHLWAEENLEGSVIDVFTIETETPAVVRSSRLALQWAAVADTDHYRVERYEEAAWALRNTIKDHGGGEHIYRSEGVDDDTTHQYRVVPVGINGVTGTPVNLTKHAVRHPYQPNHTLAYDDGAGTVTITE